MVPGHEARGFDWHYPGGVVKPSDVKWDVYQIIARRFAVSRKRGKIPLDVTIADMPVPPSPLLCPVDNQPMDWCGERSVRPEIDAVDISKGHVSGNLQWVCGRHNRIKSDATSEELRLIAEYIDKMNARAA